MVVQMIGCQIALDKRAERGNIASGRVASRPSFPVVSTFGDDMYGNIIGCIVEHEV
jgi:hypothetical protein